VKEEEWKRTPKDQRKKLDLNRLEDRMTTKKKTKEIKIKKSGR
jgi:hypothetical protein